MATLPILNKDSVYGDKTVLDEFRRSTKPLPVSGAPNPKRGPGRPAEQAAQPPAGEAIAPEHLNTMQRLAKAEEVADYWQRLAQEVPTQFTQMYAKRALEVRDRLAIKLYHDTPNAF